MFPVALLSAWSCISYHFFPGSFRFLSAYFVFPGWIHFIFHGIYFIWFTLSTMFCMCVLCIVCMQTYVDQLIVDRWISPIAGQHYAFLEVSWQILLPFITIEAPRERFRYLNLAKTMSNGTVVFSLEASAISVMMLVMRCPLTLTMVGFGPSPRSMTFQWWPMAQVVRVQGELGSRDLFRLAHLILLRCRLWASWLDPLSRWAPCREGNPPTDREAHSVATLPG